MQDLSPEDQFASGQEQEKILLKELRLSFNLSLVQFYHVDERILPSPNASGYEQQALRMCNVIRLS